MNTVRQTFYVSRIADGITDVDIRSILSMSRRKNRMSDVTGCLLVSGRFFAQVIEGSPDVIHALCLRIETDNRHDDYRVMLDRLTRRQYGNWAMGFIQNDSFEQRLEQILAGQFDKSRCEQLLGEMRIDTLFGGL